MRRKKLQRQGVMEGLQLRVGDSVLAHTAGLWGLSGGYRVEMGVWGTRDEAVTGVRGVSLGCTGTGGVSWGYRRGTWTMSQCCPCLWALWWEDTLHPRASPAGSAPPLAPAQCTVHQRCAPRSGLLLWGGSWNSSPQSLQAAARLWGAPGCTPPQGTPHLLCCGTGRWPRPPATAAFRIPAAASPPA